MPVSRTSPSSLLGFRGSKNPHQHQRIWDERTGSATPTFHHPNLALPTEFRASPARRPRIDRWSLASDAAERVVMALVVAPRTAGAQPTGHGATIAGILGWGVRDGRRPLGGAVGRDARSGRLVGIRARVPPAGRSAASARSSGAGLGLGDARRPGAGPLRIPGARAAPELGYRGVDHRRTVPGAGPCPAREARVQGTARRRRRHCRTGARDVGGRLKRDTFMDPAGDGQQRRADLPSLLRCPVVEVGPTVAHPLPHSAIRPSRTCPLAARSSLPP